MTERTETEAGRWYPVKCDRCGVFHNVAHERGTMATCPECEEREQALVKRLQEDLARGRETQVERDQREARRLEGIGCCEVVLLGLVGLGGIAALVARAVLA